MLEIHLQIFLKKKNISIETESKKITNGKK